MLSAVMQTQIDVDALKNAEDLSITLTRAKFEELYGDYFKNTLKPVEQVLNDAKVSKRQIHDIVLVGGSSKIPMVQELLAIFFNGKIFNKSINSDEAATLNKEEREILDKIILLDVTPLSLGIETAGGVMTKIIEKNTTIPVKKTQVFSTYADNHKLGIFNL